MKAPQILKINRSRFTQRIIDFAFKHPKLVPGYLQFYAEEHHSASEWMKKKKEEKPQYSSISLFEGDLHWKAISYSMLINDDELKNLKKWAEKKSLFVDGVRNRNIESRTFDNNSGWVNIGYIRINHDGYTDGFNPFYIKDEYFNGVSISLTKYSAGLSFLTFYIMLKEEVSREIKHVNVPVMNDFLELDTFNIFSRKNVGLKLKSYHEFSKDILINKMACIENSSRKFIYAVLKEIKINKQEDEVCCVSDFYLNQEPPYFDRDAKSDNENLNVYIRKQMVFWESKISTNRQESFINEHFHSIKGFDWFYLYCFPEEKMNQYNNFKKDIIYNIDSHLAIIPLFLIRKKIDYLSKYINDTKLHKANLSLEVLHERLFLVSYQLEIILLWLKSLKNDMDFNLTKEYLENASFQIENLTDRSEKLKGITGAIYSLSENRIQVNNVKYNKRLSWVVLFFALVQIVLAAMAIDPSKKEAWYYPLILWIKHHIS